MAFQKDFDELLNAILTDYKNQFPEADTSQGSLIFIKSACLASALWGLYKYQDWISLQIFPDTADTEYLEHHAWVRGLSRTLGETDAAYLARLLDYIRRPPAGGNKHDYEMWALEIDNVVAAYCLSLPQGLGTVDVIVVANKDTTGSELPSDSIRTGRVAAISANKLIDDFANFTAAAHPVAVGDIVRHAVSGRDTTVTAVDSATQLSLADDYFRTLDEIYLLHNHTGVNTSVTALKLIDSAGRFNDATYTIKPGDQVLNLTDNKKTVVVSVDSAVQLTLAEDIFTATGKKYVVKSTLGLVKENIELNRPVTASVVRILPPTIVTQAVTMTVSGAGVNKAAIAADITAYMNTLIPGQTLYKSQLLALAVQNGADNAVITVPANDVTATLYQMLRPGVINVS